jgi:hypothetical protein
MTPDRRDGERIRWQRSCVQVATQSTGSASPGDTSPRRFTTHGGLRECSVTTIGIAQSTGARSGRIVQQILLLAGVLSSLVYVTADILCGLNYPGYSFTDQVISELSAIGAPTTALWVQLLQLFAVLFAAFTIGVVRGSRGNRRLRLTGWLLVTFVLSGPLWSFVPMHQRGDVFTWSDVGHIALGGVMVLLITAVIAVGGGALGRRFRVFSQVLVTVAFISGVGTFAYVPRMIGQRPTPWVGTVERIHLYAFFLWIAVLAVLLLRRSGHPMAYREDSAT